MIEKEELLKTTTIEEFNAFLLKYHPDYDNIPFDNWNIDIAKHYAENIIGTPLEILKNMEDEIIEYDIGTQK